MTLINLDLSLRMIWAVSGSSVKDTTRGVLREVVEAEECNVAIEDIICYAGDVVFAFVI